MHALQALQGKQVPEGALPVTRRHVLYLRQAMRILGVIDAEGMITDMGEQISGDFRPMLALLFEASAVGQAWVKWAGVKGATDLDPQSATDFLVELTDLSESTCQRRARTLRRWVEFLQMVS